MKIERIDYTQWKKEDPTEYDISKELEKNFYNLGAKNLSFKSIVANDKNSAQAHYSKCSKDKYIKDGSLILIDCGAYYEQGLATDITRVFVKGSPNDLQKRVYTTVLKMLLNLQMKTLLNQVLFYSVQILKNIFLKV